MNQPFFEIRKANVWRGDVLALRDLNLSLTANENVAILGANGAGKSSLLKLMTGELRAEARPNSSCELFGESLWSLEELRHRIGIVMPEEISRFDDDEIAGDVVLSVFRGAYGRTREMRFSASEKQRALGAISATGVADLKQRFFGQLSSGEKRRFLIARAMVHTPEILVLDEPSTALDFAARLTMLGQLRRMTKTTKSIVLVTHDPSEIFPEIDRLILLKGGRIIADGPKRKILTSATLSEFYGISIKLHWSHGWPIVTAGSTSL
ncbi:MAG: ABC transporter ATP-binding protein [Verrucomicrobiota bacterium]